MSVGKIFELARACIDFMYELHDFFWEEFSLYKEVFVAHISAYWSFFLVDMREAIAHSQDTVLQLKLFHLVNNYFISQRKGGRGEGGGREGGERGGERGREGGERGGERGRGRGERGREGREGGGERGGARKRREYCIGG